LPGWGTLSLGANSWQDTPTILAFTERVNVADMDGFCADRLSHDSGRRQKKADRKNGPSASPYSRDASASPVRPVQEKLAVAESRFGILIDRDDDRLYMVVAIPFQGRLAPHIGKRLDPRRVIGIGSNHWGGWLGIDSAFFRRSVCSL